jgi:antitoxin FitA
MSADEHSGGCINTIIINLSNEEFSKLAEKAARLGLSVEELVRTSVEELITRPDAAFERAADYILKKNAELYERLS